MTKSKDSPKKISSEVSKVSKKPYLPPTLKVYGDVAQITLAEPIGKIGGNHDINGSPPNYKFS